MNTRDGAEIVVGKSNDDEFPWANCGLVQLTNNLVDSLTARSEFAAAVSCIPALTPYTTKAAEFVPMCLFVAIGAFSAGYPHHSYLFQCCLWRQLRWMARKLPAITPRMLCTREQCQQRQQTQSIDRCNRWWRHSVTTRRRGNPASAARRTQTQVYFLRGKGCSGRASQRDVVSSRREQKKSDKDDHRFCRFLSLTLSCLPP